MKRSIGILGGILLAASMSTPALATPGHGNGGGGGVSQAGGLPALAARVTADEALITTLQSQVLILQGQVTTLDAQVLDLQGQNNWAVVDSTGALVRSFSSAGPVTATHVATGQYEVTFSKDVSGCAYQATIGGTANTAPAQGQISVSGDTDASVPNDVYVQTFDVGGTVATDAPFHLNVTCP